MSSPHPNGIGTKFLLTSAAIIVILAGLKAAQSLISPFLLAVFFALILTPPLRWLKKKGFSDGVAILTLSTFVFLMGLGIVLVFSNSLTHFASKLPAYKEKVAVGYTTIDTWINNVADKFNALGETIQQYNPISEFESSEPNNEPDSENETTPPPIQDEDIPNDLLEQIRSDRSPVSFVSQSLSLEKGALFTLQNEEEWLAERQLTVTPETSKTIDESTDKQNAPPVREKLSLSDVIPVNTLISSIQIVVNSLLGMATVSMLVIIMVMFMLIEAARLPDKIKEAFGGRDLSNEYFKKIADDTWNYMKIKTVICFLTGLSTFIGLWFLGVEYALLWGLLMFFLNYIPNIGQVIASIPPILLALIDGGVVSAMLVTAWLVLVNSALGLGVEPRFMGQGLGISSLVILLSLIFWGWLLGPVGMFLSAPLTMVMKIILQNDSKTRWIAVLLSNR